MGKVKKFNQTSGISKQDSYNYASSTFYYKNNSKIKTIISFLDYWNIKNSLKVDIEATTFNMSGKLICKEKIDLSNANVKNIYPLNKKNGEGAIEIKIFSKVNLRVPYAAIMGIYETKFGISAVHSYSRYYYQQENILNKGYEGSWTIRDSKNIRSFCVFHNGNEIQRAQKVKFQIHNERGKVLNVNIELPDIPRNGTIKLRLGDYVENLENFLCGGVGVVSSQHKVKNSFSRMLIGNESKQDGLDMQVTHSNFNYKVHGSDLLDKDSISLKPYPGLINENSEFIIYPHLVPGKYLAKIGNKKYDVINNEKIIRIPINKKYREYYQSKKHKSNFIT